MRTNLKVTIQALILSLIIHAYAMAQCTYTTSGAGDYFVGTNWANGLQPPNPIPNGVTVTLSHAMTVGGILENNGTLNGTTITILNGGGYGGTGIFNGDIINNGAISPGQYVMGTIVNTLAGVSTSDTSNVTATGATTGGYICHDGNASVMARGVCYGLNPTPDITGPKTTDGMGTGTFVSTLSGLMPGTTYYVRAYATNSVGTSYGQEITFMTTAGPSGVPNICNPSNPTAIVDVINPVTMKTWMDRNLGANRAATSSTDTMSYGSLFQWGRGADGHQCVNRYAGDGVTTSGTTSTLSSTDTTGHGDFILVSSLPFDWRSPKNDNLWQGVSGVNNPCPSGYRLPTDAELDAEMTSWGTNNAAGALASPLKLPLAGFRDYSAGSPDNGGTFGIYWSSTVSGTNARDLFFGSVFAVMAAGGRALGNSVRCIKDDSPAGAIGSIDCSGATHTGTLTSGVAASGVSSSVPYMGGNGGAHGGQTVTSTGVTGLTATLAAGSFASGDGSLVYTITGTPGSSGTASFALNIGGQMCTLTRTVAAGAFTCGDVLNYGGEDYNTVMIGTQCWMAENLNIGTMIIGATNMTNNSTIEKYCYNNDAANCTTYGGLYQWNEMMQYTTTQGTQGICPTGWHLPTDAEWTNLETALPSPDKGSRLADNAGLWTNGALDQSLNFGTSGFVALPTGFRNIGGSFVGQSINTAFWSSAEDGASDAWVRYLYYDDTEVSQSTYDKSYGFSVRCVQD